MTRDIIEVPPPRKFQNVASQMRYVNAVSKAFQSPHHDTISARNEVMDLAQRADFEVANLAYQLGSEKTFVDQLQRALNRWLPMVDEFALGEEAANAAGDDAYLLCGLTDVSGREFGKEVVERKDTRIAELEAQVAALNRSCDHWEEELRIYREADGRRVAELEQSTLRMFGLLAEARDSVGNERIALLLPPRGSQVEITRLSSLLARIDAEMKSMVVEAAQKEALDNAPKSAIRRIIEAAERVPKRERKADRAGNGGTNGHYLSEMRGDDSYTDAYTEWLKGWPALALAVGKIPMSKLSARHMPDLLLVVNLPERPRRVGGCFSGHFDAPDGYAAAKLAAHRLLGVDPADESEDAARAGNGGEG